ncbi:hypothetical protein MMC30_007637 [Trapelia coarctata]|nr:hypothetical protein [Trapelia coarctata]
MAPITPNHMNIPRSLAPSTWLSTLSNPPFIKENNPHYWAKDPNTLLTTAHVPTLTLGTGLSLYLATLLPVLRAAEQEILFVTCFWASSPSLSALSSTLLYLSKKALNRNDGTKIRVRIGFSSRSLWQKLFHTSSAEGYVYPPLQWVSKLGLPPPEQLRGLDLEVRSLFFRPFSIMHPKFAVVDRARACMPSCNVSWETWLECSISLSGPIVGNLVEFWRYFWGHGKLPALRSSSSPPPSDNNNITTTPTTPSIPPSLPSTISLPQTPHPTLLLPSPHHSSLLLSLPLPFLPSPPPPATPLNTLLLHLFSTATTSIHILTPNLTSQPVVSSLLAALARGVDVSIVTNRRMMLLEQLVTAGTVTEVCVWGFVRGYKRLLKRGRGRGDGRAERGGDLRLLEEGRAGLRELGKLKIGYYRPCPRPRLNLSVRASAGTGYGGGDGGRSGAGGDRDRGDETGNRDAEPVKSHVKCTVIDGEVVVLGSGNMDRASWFTSQELGIALYGREVTGMIWGSLEGALEGRVEDYFEV